jgi:nicotinate-nucleotide--dimethylbenzimidazole phosphoribosyltransferase
VIPIAAPGESLEGLIARISPLDDAAMALAADRLDRLTKPTGSLGRLEALAIQLAGIRGRLAGVDRSAIVVFAADHGIVAQGVSAYPSAVTRQMVANYATGGAAINVLAAASDAALVVVDVGIAGPALDAGLTADTGEHGRAAARVHARRVRPGSRDFSVEPALTREEVSAAIDAGRRTIDELVARGIDIVGIGEMGIGNTTSASALVAALPGDPPKPSRAPGRGSTMPASATRSR